MTMSKRVVPVCVCLTTQWSLRLFEVFWQSAAGSSRCVWHSTLHLHALLFKLLDGAAYLGVRVASASGGVCFHGVALPSARATVDGIPSSP